MSQGGIKMSQKEKYILDINNRFNGNSRDILLGQVNLFYQENIVINKPKYEIGDEVKLLKGTFVHGIPGMLENFDWIVENGFIGNDFTQDDVHNKIKNSIGMWIIKNDCLLRDYVAAYSGFTITYTIGRGPGSKEISELIPYHQFDRFTEKINDDENIWMYWGDQTKEIRFLPSLVANKRQIAFILNMNNDYAKEISSADVWDLKYDKETLKDFLDYRYYDKFLTERVSRTAQTTDRETAIMFGLPVKLIEGVLVGRKIEYDNETLEYIKSKLPDCYICNLDGKVLL